MVTDVTGSPAVQELTRRERQVLEFIRDTVTSRGFPPTLRETAKAVSLASTNSVADVLRRLTDKGYIRRESGKPRAITLVTPKEGGF